MPLPKEQLTIDDIYNLPDGTRAELIDGQMYMMAPPSTTHQKLSGEIFTDIKSYIRSKKGPCQVFAAPFAVFLDKENNKYVEPDISIICDNNKIDDKGCHGAPDWVIEIVSPSSKRMDYYIKLASYRIAGVREYWIIDPQKETVIVYDMVNDSGPTIYSLSDKVKVNIYDDLYIDFREITQAINS
ncbi:MAG: Uma2 family endonuclease [Lachnospiraceae bacterium]